MFLKKCKKAAAMLIVMLIAANTVNAQFYDVPQELSSYGQEIYSIARSYHGRSFSGYCGTYVRCKLRAMGIFEGGFDLRGNGNQWYANFDNVTMTSGGYSVYSESGRDCLKKLVEKYGNGIKNIVISFPIQSGYSASRPGAGHAFVIYEIRDNIAYYSESFSFGSFREGQVIAEDIDSLVERYSRRHGNPTGAVMLSKTQVSQAEETEALNPASFAMMYNIKKISETTIVESIFSNVIKTRAVL